MGGSHTHSTAGNGSFHRSTTLHSWVVDSWTPGDERHLLAHEHTPSYDQSANKLLFTDGKKKKVITN
jgi:hypothetical protein